MKNNTNTLALAVVIRGRVQKKNRGCYTPSILSIHFKVNELELSRPHDGFDGAIFTTT